MPQLSQIGEIYASQLFWLAIVFGLIYFGIGKAMVPRIERTIDDRGARVAGDLAAAEAARATARESDEVYHTQLDAARSQAMRTVGDAAAAATATAEANAKASDEAMASRMAEVAARIERTKQQALGEIEASTADTVQAIVAKLSGVSIDPGVAQHQVRVELTHG